MRKPTKCLQVKGCPETPAFLISSYRLTDHPVCLEHGKPFLLSLTYKIVSLWDEAPRIAKKAAKGKK